MEFPLLSNIKFFVPQVQLVLYLYHELSNWSFELLLPSYWKKIWYSTKFWPRIYCKLFHMIPGSNFQYSIPRITWMLLLIISHDTPLLFFVRCDGTLNNLTLIQIRFLVPDEFDKTKFDLHAFLKTFFVFTCLFIVSMNVVKWNMHNTSCIALMSCFSLIFNDLWLMYIVIWYHIVKYLFVYIIYLLPGLAFVKLSIISFLHVLQSHPIKALMYWIVF